MTKQVGKGLKSGQFPVFGRATADFHVPGAEVEGQVIAQAEKEIFVDEMLLAAVNVADIDEMLEHYDSRSFYTSELADALRKTEESHLVRCLARGATENSPVTGGDNGVSVTIPSTTAYTGVTAAKLRAAISQVAQTFDERSVPDDSRYMLLTPGDHRLLVDDTSALHRDVGGVGSLSEGTLPKVHGINLIKSNRLNALRGTNHSTNPTGAKNDYTADMRKTVGLAFHKTALGTVQRLGMTPDLYWRGERFQWQVSIRSLTGHDVLREGAIAAVNLA
jgi:hypothetical protein